MQSGFEGRGEDLRGIYCVSGTVAITFFCKLSHSRSLGSVLAGSGLSKVLPYG